MGSPLWRLCVGGKDNGAECKAVAPLQTIRFCVVLGQAGSGSLVNLPQTNIWMFRWILHMTPTPSLPEGLNFVHRFQPTKFCHPFVTRLKQDRTFECKYYCERLRVCLHTCEWVSIQLWTFLIVYNIYIQLILNYNECMNKWSYHI